jgi:peptidoglycan/xylan/chitin deacetylase (PgdA/CDA1 family)
MRTHAIPACALLLAIVVACSEEPAPADAAPIATCEQGEDACATYACALEKAPPNASPGAASDVAMGAQVGPAPAHPPVYVSLTFDDSFADQYQLIEILRPYGMKATLYVNSARIGERTYLTQEQLAAFEAEGHEIAGHTVTHPTLPAVDEDEQRRQVCNDRLALLQRGFAVRSFAYPHGAFTPLTQHIVDDCGYNSARIVGGLGCDGCPGGEPAAPGAIPNGTDKLAVRSPSSIKCNTTLLDMQQEVRAAEANGGGWVPMVFHHVCEGCGQNAVSPRLFQQFVAWLAARRGAGTEVKTVGDMVGGEVRPGKAGPPPAPPKRATGNILEDPGFEDPAPESPDIARCWVKGGEGENVFDYGRTEDAHSGRFAQWLEVKEMKTGARRILSRQDLGYCAPVIVPGRSYRVSAWYKSTVSPRFTAYYRESSGFWKYWATSKPLPRSDGWTQQSFDLPPAPEDASGISVSLTLTEAGRIVMDDLSVQDRAE